MIKALLQRCDGTVREIPFEGGHRVIEPLFEGSGLMASAITKVIYEREPSGAVRNEAGEIAAFRYREVSRERSELCGRCGKPESHSVHVKEDE